ncbi:hypothetical protein DSM110093_02608 [Sulfitobacter sp. DSM 110093]|uniref:DUF1826 domain-containing protein n=1 Tax=Sulfitobacter sp. DSM 110093 TaxID=2883127 RepID=UPI001FAB37EC|nr:DUF1826 domain-containing protein [Sulfitobacter sp. DSM 110093]UOA32804.1 hypothetical protein DSM110093_02608 [Sulfitobacter sp. DSM 110093]
MILDTTAPLKRCTNSSGMSAIHTPGTAATVWERAPLRGFQDWIDALPPSQLPRARVILRPEAVCNALIEITDFHKMPDCPERNMLIEDASALALIFGDLMRCDHVQLRLDVVDTNACSKFHIDAVTARLVCTYRGTGTQCGISETGNDPVEILTVPTGSPIILRGTRWPESPPAGLLHRSPPIAGTGETRLLLVLDPIADPEQEDDAGYFH